MKEKPNNPCEFIIKKSRYFSLSSYATEKQIMKIMRKHVSSIRAFCYIHHNKEEAEPHYHVLLRTHSTWTVAQIARWFELLKDEEGKYINTFVEYANDMEGLKVYILHADKKSIEAGKPLYDKSDIVDYGYNDLTDRKCSCDNSYEIMQRMLLGENPRSLLRKYGRDFLYHISAYYDCLDRIRDYEGVKESRTLTRIETMELEPITEEDLDNV